MGRSIVLPTILVSVLQAFGIEENSVGAAIDPTITIGTLDQLKG